MRVFILLMSAILLVNLSACAGQSTAAEPEPESSPSEALETMLRSEGEWEWTDDSRPDTPGMTMGGAFDSTVRYLLHFYELASFGVEELEIGFQSEPLSSQLEGWVTLEFEGGRIVGLVGYKSDLRTEEDENGDGHVVVEGAYQTVLEWLEDYQTEHSLKLKAVTSPNRSFFAMTPTEDATDEILSFWVASGEGYTYDVWLENQPEETE